MTEPLTKLPAALAKFQAQHAAAGRDGKGNFGAYTTLGGAIAAVQPACEQGLSHTQTLAPIGDDLMVLRTTLMHTSGEQISSDLPLPIRYQSTRGSEMQAMGSALTYARRYSLLAIYGLAGEDDDDDGETAIPAKAEPAKAPQPLKKTATPAQASAAPVKQGPPAAKLPANAEPPLPKEERSLVVDLLKNKKDEDPERFSVFLDAFRTRFGLAPDAGVASAIQTLKHAAFVEEFFATPS